jgi:hypothetical protein
VSSDWLDPWDEPGNLESPGSALKDTPPLKYANVGEWVTHWLADVFRRHRTANRVWCPHWFRHAEAVSVLEGAWRAWEHMPRPAEFGGDEWLGQSLWWHVHGYPAMDRLTALDGPFHDAPTVTRMI